MNKAQKIAEIRRLISGDDDRHKAFYFTGTKPEGFRPGKDYLIYLFDDEMEAKAKALKPFMFIGCSKKEYCDALISITNPDPVEQLVNWLNNDQETPAPIAQPMEGNQYTKESNLPKVSLNDETPPPMEAPAPPPPPEIFTTFRDKGTYRRNRI